MFGYDSLVGVWNESDRDWESVPWDKRGESISGKRSYYLSTEKIQFHRTEVDEIGTGFPLYRGTRFQCSLPRILYGNNVHPVSFDSGKESLDCLHLVMQEYFPACMHPRKMTPRRIDITDDRSVNPHDMQSLLRSLSTRSISRIEPFISQSKGVYWPGSRWGFGRKAYDKYLESKEPEALGIMRIESSALGLHSIKNAYLKAKPDASVRNLSIGMLFDCEDFMKQTLGPLPDIVDEVFQEVGRVTSTDAVQILVKHGFSFPKSAAMLGYASIVQRSGWSALKITKQSIQHLKRDFESAHINPFDITWT